MERPEEAGNPATPLPIEVALVEYQTALEQSRHYASLRRQDMAFATTAQAAVFTVLGTDTLDFSVRDWLLSGIAFFIILLALNSERRNNGYFESCMVRAGAIEKSLGLRLCSDAPHFLKKRRRLLSNSLVFPLYYLLFAATWVAIWLFVLFS